MYENYIFDLYGTLIDIHTDEHKPKLWNTMARIYDAYGAEYDPEEMEKIFFEMDREARKKLAMENGSDYPEIQYEPLFARLLLEAEKTHPVTAPLPEKRSVEELAASPWTALMANVFRIESRRRFRLFPGVLKTLIQLKKEGKRVFLLSNAQAVFTRPELEQTGLVPLFDDIYLSSDYGIMKPDPRFLTALMEKHGLKKENTLMTGDDFHADAGIALENGVHAAILNTHGNTEEVMEKYKKDALKRHKVRDTSMIHLVMKDPFLPNLPKGPEA